MELQWAADLVHAQPWRFSQIWRKALVRSKLVERGPVTALLQIWSCNAIGGWNCIDLWRCCLCGEGVRGDASIVKIVALVSASLHHHCRSCISCCSIRNRIVMTPVSHDLLSHGVELGLQWLSLLLQSGDRTHAPIYRIADASIRLVHQAACGIGALALRDLHQHLGDVTSTEYLVHARKLLGLVRGEIGRERALLCASPAQELAGSTRSGGIHLPLVTHHDSSMEVLSQNASKTLSTDNRANRSTCCCT